MQELADIGPEPPIPAAERPPGPAPVLSPTPPGRSAALGDVRAHVTWAVAAGYAPPMVSQKAGEPSMWPPRVCQVYSGFSVRNAARSAAAGP
ncbi:hypothetical protein [Mangrovihabitans endophyticus]|uniref:Uncharacterized protein n=1 Tax=Mangrovihabitans endophyticus TaxID=1751298 RepID=A0A8J3FRH9_9ACTN|nr:hypothetical protein [Mangrovihabitans endophyticus]GGL16258.1 hypothetical protein GCM10012284_58590 [Mangrovihabitans endophyticus]